MRLTEHNKLVHTIDLTVEYRFEFDHQFQQDKLIADLLLDGQKTGHYAVMVLDKHAKTFGYALEMYGPTLRRAVVDAYIESTKSLAKRISELEKRVS